MTSVASGEAPTSDTGRQLVRLGLAGVLSLGALGGVLIWASVATEVPLVSAAVPALMLAALAAAAFRPGLEALLSAVIVGSVALFGGGAGLSVAEVAFAIGAMGYLAVWTVTAVTAQAGVLRSAPDVAAAAWCVIAIPAGCLLGLIFGADAYDFRADLQAALFFPFYFPVKEVVRRDPRGVGLVTASIVGLGVMAAAHNMLDLRSQLAAATKIYEIVDVRVADGMIQISAGILVGLSVLATSRHRALRIALLVALAMMLAGLVVGKSRAFWVAVMLGVAVLGALLPNGDRRRLGLTLGVGALSVIGLGTLLAGDQLALIGAGAIDRLVTLGATGQDISLVNRFVETEAAMTRIFQNPLLGHGWGTQITYYSLIGQGTQHWAFLHNGYVALWFKVGLWGFALMMTIWLGVLTRGIWTVRTRATLPPERALLTGTVATLTVFLLTSITSNPFSIMDQVLTLAVLLGAASGVCQREQDGASRLVS